MQVMTNERRNSFTNRAKRFEKCQGEEQSRLVVKVSSNRLPGATHASTLVRMELDDVLALRGLRGLTAQDTVRIVHIAKQFKMLENSFHFT